MKPAALGIQDHVHACILLKTQFYSKITVFKTILQHKQDK